MHWCGMFNGVACLGLRQTFSFFWSAAGMHRRHVAACVTRCWLTWGCVPASQSCITRTHTLPCMRLPWVAWVGATRFLFWGKLLYTAQTCSSMCDKVLVDLGVRACIAKLHHTLTRLYACRCHWCLGLGQPVFFFGVSCCTQRRHVAACVTRCWLTWGCVGLALHSSIVWRHPSVHAVASGDMVWVDWVLRCDLGVFAKCVHTF
jgi:hypothetical protein